MKTVPKKWTHYHIHRLYHISMLVCFSFALTVVVVGQFFFAYQASAGTVTDYKDINIVANVPSILPGPTVVETGNSGGGIYPTPASTTTFPSLPFESLPTVSVSLKDGLVIGKKPFISEQNKEQTIDIIETQYPEFVGKTNIPGANIYLEIDVNPKIRAKTYVNKNGDWAWKSPVPLQSGVSTLIVTAKNETVKELQVSAKFNFYVQLPVKLITDETKVPPDAYAITGELEPFSVLLKIPDEFKIVAPGEEFLAQIKFSNLGSVKKPTAVDVYYIIKNEQNETLLSYKEQLTVTGETSLIKSFRTSHTLPTGGYLLSVKIYTQDSVVVSGDTFFIKGQPVVSLGQYAKIDYTLVFQALGLLVFLFLLIMYFEYNKVNLLSSLIRRVSEEDLKSDIK